MTYRDAIIICLKRLGGHAYYQDIYKEFEQVYDGQLSKTWQASVRATIERNSSDSTVFNGKEDLFVSIDGLGKGHWGLRNYCFLNDINE